MERYRRNLVTYPFHYEVQGAEEFFEPAKGAIYIHLPFCNQKCKYCNFKAYKLLDEDYINRYLECVKRHLELFRDLRHYPEYKVDCLNFGGGNPGLLQAEQIVSLIDAVDGLFDVCDGAEISMEFDPIDVTPEKLDTLCEAGVNRISMGVQSFDDEILAQVGRVHTGQEAKDAYQLMKKAGFQNINLDLVYPFPELTQEKWEETVDELVELQPPAISTYGLELWPGTPYFQEKRRGDFSICTGDEEAAMYTAAQSKILAAGYDQVTVYAYVQSEFNATYHCRYMEEYYWNNRPKVGIGVAAMNYLGGDFFVNERNVPRYMDKVERGEYPFGFGRHLSWDERMRRFMIRGLKKGTVSRSDFHARYGHQLEEYFARELQSCAKQGLAVVEGDLVRLTPLGLNYNTNVYREFFRPTDLIDETDGTTTVYFGLSLDVDAPIEDGEP